MTTPGDVWRLFSWPERVLLAVIAVSAAALGFLIGRADADPHAS